MTDTVVIDEKYSSNWKITLYTSLLLAAITFVIYINIDDVIWTGIFRLTAFMSFSLSVFCLLKIMEGQKRFRLEVDNNSIHIAYLKKEKVVHEEVLDQKDVIGIYKVPSELRVPILPYKIKLTNSWLFMVKLANDAYDSSLFTFSGKPLAVDKKSGNKLEHFLDTHNLYTHP